jgi:N-dimethylarginine dimethylaminohydrolase
MRQEGFHIIKLTNEDQYAYGCNQLNLGCGNILSVHEETARKISRSKNFFFI